MSSGSSENDVFGVTADGQTDQQADQGDVGPVLVQHGLGRPAQLNLPMVSDDHRRAVLRADRGQAV